MAKPRILIVSDDGARRATLARWLLAAGYAVELAESPRRAQEVIASESLNLALVDRHLGAENNELARAIAGHVKRTIFIAQPEKEGEAAFAPSGQAGVSLSWPCSEQDVLASVRAELTSAPPATAESGPQRFRFEGYLLDADARSCLDAQGQEVTLTRAEFSLLLAFVRQPGKVLSRDELTQVAIGRGAEPDDRSVDVLISRLRRKIEPDPKTPRWIVTMPGEGYKFTARPQAVAADPDIAAPSVTAAAVVTTAVSGDSPAVAAAGTPVAASEKPARSTRALRSLIPAAVILIAAVGWVAWRNHLPPRQAVEASAAQPAVSAERRASAFKRMVEAMQDDRFNWRTVERLAIESGVDETEAREILAEHLDQVVLGKSHDGKLIARLTTR